MAFSFLLSFSGVAPALLGLPKKTVSHTALLEKKTCLFFWVLSSLWDIAVVGDQEREARPGQARPTRFLLCLAWGLDAFHSIFDAAIA